MRYLPKTSTTIPSKGILHTLYLGTLVPHRIWVLKQQDVFAHPLLGRWLLRGVSACGSLRGQELQLTKHSMIHFPESPKSSGSLWARVLHLGTKFSALGCRSQEP